MFGLGQQVRRHQLGIGGGVGEHRHLRGTGQQVDPDSAEQLALASVTCALPGPTIMSTGSSPSIPNAIEASA